MKITAFIRSLAALIFLLIISSSDYKIFSQEIPDNIRILLEKLSPLSYERGNRELIYQYSIGDLSRLSDKDTELVIKELSKRGIGVITFWKQAEAFERGIEEGIRIARLQENLGLKVAVDATDLLYGFYDKTDFTAHIDNEGRTFYDSSFAGHWMGCPFTLQERIPVIRSRIIAYSEAYQAAGVNIDIVTADWEIDGPHEWNEAWVNSKKCMTCCKNIDNIQDFYVFQSKLRSLRSKLLEICYTRPILERHPKALITNYGTYPNDGWRYWYDYFESPQIDLPNIKDQKAIYRPWCNEFTETGFTMAMPVVYTWYPIYNSYPEYTSDYRWFYNMLKVGTNAGKSTPSEIPIATFFHWHTTAPPEKQDLNVKQMSRHSYQELLWHLLLRGHDIFFSWCMKEEIETEMTLLQEVYNNSLNYNDWLQSGRPVLFEVPAKESSVVSGVKLNNQVLVRRTDFTDNKKAVKCIIDDKIIMVPYKPGECQIITIE